MIRKRPLPRQAIETKDDTLIDVRKLAALDIAFHGPRLTLAEFGFGVFFCAALGLFLFAVELSAGRAHSPFRIVVAGFSLFVALNYAPLLLYAIAITRRGSAHAEVARELAQRDRYARKYGAQQFLLLVPLVVPILAIVQEARKRSRR